jgi:prevent-host-death family protein
MIKVNVQDAKTNLSRYLDQVEQGEVLIICRHNQPVGELRAISASTATPVRVPGLLKGQVQWKHNAFDPMAPEELAEFDSASLFPSPLSIS